ncbi:unnamed protein product, partial [Discosporangium mesarthrocarpum]
VCFGGSQSRERTVLEGQINAFVGRINSKLASIDLAGPVQFFIDINLQARERERLGSKELCALYALANVLVITPIRDGMNIVPFEYVISRESRGRPATVVLSEFAGCARSIGGAILINPWNTTELAEKIIEAIDTDPTERELRRGGGGFRWRLLVFNLEGVLARPCALSELVKVPTEVSAALDALSREGMNMVVVKSPRGRETLERLLGHTNCVLAAEHGAFFRWGKHARWK